MRVRHALPIVCAALLVPSAPAGADEVPQPEPAPAAAEPVAAAAAQALAPTASPTPIATPQATPAAAAQAAPAAQATPAPTPKAAATPQATPAPPAAPAPTPPSVCATPVESSGECRVPSAVCGILGTDGDDVLTGTPMDDILCGFGGDDQLEGGDGSDVLFGGDGDDVLVGGEGHDCMVGGPGTDGADTTPGESAEVEQSADNEPTGSIIFDPGGRCIGGVKPEVYVARGTPPKVIGAPGRAPADRPGSVGGLTPIARPRAPAPAPPRIAPPGAGVAPAAASSSPSGRVGLRLPRGALAVRRGVVRLRVSCSASAPGELVLLAGSRRIAHRRFACRRPGRTLRVRLNAAGQRLVARDDRVRTLILVLAGGRTDSRRVLLVSRRG